MTVIKSFVESDGLLIDAYSERLTLIFDHENNKQFLITEKGKDVTFTFPNKEVFKLNLTEMKSLYYVLGDIIERKENKWDQKVPDVYVLTEIFNEIGELITSFESASHDIEPLSKYSFQSFWDTAGVLKGTYETEISINYADVSSKKSVKFVVEDDSLTVLGVGYVISSGAGESAGLNNIIIILIVVIVLMIIINLLWFLWIRKRLKKK